jgi:hypothetical protein
LFPKNTSNETLQSIKVYINRQESLDPYQEDDLEQGSDEHSDKNNSHPDKNEDNDSFTSTTEVSTNTTTTSNNTSHGNSNQNNLNGSNCIQATDPCPLPGHLGHNWGQCFHNANNSIPRPTPRTYHSPERDAHVNKRSHKSA